MSRSDEHAEIREQFPLLVAGALDADAEARIARIPRPVQTAPPSSNAGS